MGEGTINRIFVYGTLKPGGRFNYLTAGLGLKSVSPAYIDGFDLYGLKPQNYPGIVPGRGRVYGDVLEFESIIKGLEVLDELEGVAKKPPLYHRQKTIIFPQQKEAWVYIFNMNEFKETTKLILIKSGEWKADD